MKHLAKSLVAVFGVLLSVEVAAGDPDADREKIGAVFAAYERALNASDTEAVMALYAEDAVFMPQHSKPNVGESAVRTAYENVFQAIDLEIGFTVDEVLLVAPDWAFARTRSEGIVTVIATGQKGPEANQEVFLLERVHDEWKIARYIFSTTNPPRR